MSFFSSPSPHERIEITRKTRKRSETKNKNIQKQEALLFSFVYPLTSSR